MRRLPSRSTRTATLLPDTTLFRSAVRGLGAARVGGGEIAMKDLEVGNGEPSQRVGPRREQRTHDDVVDRSEEHTSELQSLMRNSYAVFCLNKHKTEHLQSLSYL